MDRKRIALSSSIKWSEGLPENVLDQILNFCGLRDSIRMGSACKSWLSVFKWNTSRRPPQLPWLMMPSNPNCKSAEEEGAEGRCFFSLSDHTIYTIKVPEIRGRLCCASFNNGWLMTIDPNLLNIRLFHPWRFHPYHRIQLQLPNLSINDSIHVFRGRPYKQFKTLQIRKAVISDDAAVVAIINAKFQFKFCRTGKDKVWNSVDVLYRCFADIIYHKGRFYCIDLSSDDIVVIYINNNNTTYKQIIRVTRVAIHREGRLAYQTYLVADTASENLFIVKRRIRWQSVQSESVLMEIPKTYAFEVYELGLEESTRKRNYKNNPVRVESLGDRVMFLGQNSSMLVMASQFSGFKGNCIYFTADDFLVHINFDSLPIGLGDNGVFSMEDKTISPLFPDRAHPPFSPPIWITPLL